VVLSEDAISRMKKILIIGHPGAGKTTLAVEMGKLLHLPVIHLDREFWQSGWRQSERGEWRERVRRMVMGEKWVIDGTYDNSLDIRLPHADTIIFLDFPKGVCLRRVIGRMLRGYGRVRPDMADGCRERFDGAFIKFVWEYRKIRRPRILTAMKEYSPDTKVIRLVSSREVDLFARELKEKAP
jgi:adenylate kinase family enzyme